MDLECITRIRTEPGNGGSRPTIHDSLPVRLITSSKRFRSPTKFETQTEDLLPLLRGVYLLRMGVLGTRAQRNRGAA